MGVPILVLGESGTGKSTSLRNFKKGELAIVNVAGKPLPFKGSFESISGTVDFRKIYTFLKATKAKSIVIDDAQYIMSFQYMRRIKENGWDKFNELQSDFFNLIDCVKDLPDDVVVYFLSHLETKEDGRQKIKTIGKMLDEKITIEGMFTVVLKTYTADGKYYFLTQNSGSDTTKSPMGMFPSYAIDNDLKYVDEKIRNYYELGEFLSDEEMREIDEAAAKVDVIKDEVEGKKRRSARGKKDDGSAENVKVGGNDTTGLEGRTRRRGKATEENMDNDSKSDEQGQPTVSENAGDAEPPRRRNRRSVGESMAEERAAVEKENAEKIANAGLDQAEGEEGVPFNEVKTPDLTNPPRRKRRGNADEQECQADPNDEASVPAGKAEEKEEKSAEENTGETRTRRRRGTTQTKEPTMNPPETDTQANGTPVSETEQPTGEARRRRRRV